MGWLDNIPVWILSTVITVVGIALAIGIPLSITSRQQRKVDAEYAAALRDTVAERVRHVDAVIPHLRSPLAPADLREKWEELKRDHAAAPDSREATERIIAAHQNLTYLAGIENGDGQMRTQAVNELIVEARNFGAEHLVGPLHDLRANASSPHFCGEYASLATALGPYSHAWCKREFDGMKKLVHALGDDAFPDAPAFYERDFRPGAGMGGYLPLDRIWRALQKGTDAELYDSLEEHYPGDALFYKRWLPEVKVWA